MRESLNNKCDPKKFRNRWPKEYEWLLRNDRGLLYSVFGIRVKKSNPKGHWNKERCIEVAKKYKTRGEFCKNEGTAYGAVCKNGWLEECCKHMVIVIVKSRDHWNKERCISAAKKCKIISEFYRKQKGAYTAARKNGWLQECYKYMGRIRESNGHWNKQRCIETARKYTTRNEFIHKESGAYSAAQRNGWMEECCKHMIQIKKPHGYWNKQRCAGVAQTCKTRVEFKKKESSAFAAATKNSWLEECCKHMIKSNGSKKQVKCIETKEIFESLVKAAKENNLLSHMSIFQAIKNKSTAAGYHWEYAQ